LVWDVHICLARTTVPVNAPQLGAAVNGLAMSATDSSPFSFLSAASTTNPAIPDFKTIAASFFAVPTATTSVAPVETKATTGAKSPGPFLPRERDGNKEKDTQTSELTAAFLPTNPVYPLPMLTPQAPKHMEAMSLRPQADTKDGSSASSFMLPLENQRQGFDQTRPIAPNVSFVPLQQTLRNAEPQKAVVELAQLDAQNIAIQDAPITDANTVMPARAFANSNPTTTTAILDDINTSDAVKGTVKVSKTKVVSKTQEFPGLQPNTDARQPQTKVASDSAMASSTARDKESKPSEANHITTGLNTTEIDTRQKNAASFGEQLSSRLAKPTAAIESKKSSQTEQLFDAHQNEVTDEANRADSSTAVDQTPQQNLTPQSLAEVIEAVPQAVVLEHTVKGQTQGQTPSLRAAPLAKPAANKSNHTESCAAEVNTIASPLPERALPDQLDTPRAVPAIESTTKAAAKTKSDTTVKKGQKVGAEDQVASASSSLGSSHTEGQPASSAQSAANKIHDAVTQLNVGPHAKPATTTNAPQSSDPTSANTTQVPDVDDITPPSHAGINTAKLVQGLTQSELRVGLQTREFGNIDIRTSASRHEFSAQISVQHSEVAHTLTAELPNLYARLNEQQVPVTNIHIHNQSLSTSSGLDQRFQQSAQQLPNSGFTKQQTGSALPSVHEVFASTDRLDIRV